MIKPFRPIAAAIPRQLPRGAQRGGSFAMMKRRSLLVALSALLIGAADPPEPELVVAADGIVPATVNGVPGRIRIDPAVPSLALLSTRWANEAQLRPGPFAFGMMVGPQQVDGVTAVGRIGVGDGGEVRRRRIGWTRLPYTEAADGVIGPGGVPQNVIRFVLGPSQPGERTVALPLADEGGMFGGWGHSYALIELGGERLRVRFDPHHPRTLATAGAGVRLAQAFDGRVAGEVEPVTIAFGIARPVRTLRLGRPLQIGPLAIAELGVRTSDFGSAGSIREEGGDPDEIVVTADRRRDTDRDRITIGADLLSRCSAIVFDKRRREVRLTCA
jgi:hypothetical protein